MVIICRQAFWKFQTTWLKCEIFVIDFYIIFYILLLLKYRISAICLAETACIFLFAAVQISWNKKAGRDLQSIWIHTNLKHICVVIGQITVMKIEKLLINDRLRVSKVSWKFCVLTIYNFAVIFFWNLFFS